MKIRPGRTQKPRVSVIIPAMNEEQNLPCILPLLPSIVDEVILVDGHSTDNTIQVARQLLPSIQIVTQAGRGKGEALRTGFAVSRGDIIIMLDADGSADPTEIPRFVSALMEGYDCVKGSRFKPGGGSFDITPLRRLGNAIFCHIVNLLFGTNISDLCYGYVAFWRSCLDQIQLDSEGFEVETQLYLRMLKAHLGIAEIPSIENLRIYGRSNLHTIRDGWRVLSTIVHEWRQGKTVHTEPLKTLPTQLHTKEKISV
ncbi:glycosyltransferase family 2 protein [Thermosporothrix hazakensis]|uniref:glycosyltransferase family 2 protein n=1 Tax=Thermosporothrix hazakensis TaxID=644383 RepID=UPI001FE976DD|nr:glycosyltransferase family 2 protein [Thermosporothrix hazakensis]